MASAALTARRALGLLMLLAALEIAGGVNERAGCPAYAPTPAPRLRPLVLWLRGGGGGGEVKAGAGVLATEDDSWEGPDPAPGVEGGGADGDELGAAPPEDDGDRSIIDPDLYRENYYEEEGDAGAAQAPMRKQWGWLGKVMDEVEAANKADAEAEDAELRAMAERAEAACREAIALRDRDDEEGARAAHARAVRLVGCARFPACWRARRNCPAPRHAKHRLRTCSHAHLTSNPHPPCSLPADPLPRRSAVPCGSFPRLRTPDRGGRTDRGSGERAQSRASASAGRSFQRHPRRQWDLEQVACTLVSAP